MKKNYGCILAALITDGLRTKERRQCDNSTPRKDGQGRVPVGNQKKTSRAL